MTEDKRLIVDGKRGDGRTPEELRNVRIETGMLKEADGSAYIEWGGNRIVCGVYGPKDCIPRHAADPYKAILKCRYMMSPFASQEEHGKSGPSRRSTELSKVIRHVFENLVIAERFPNTQIEIFLDVLQASGGTRTASITAAAVALANAGIPMRDMVAAVSVGKADGKVLVDLDKEEDNSGQSDMPIAIARNSKEILLLQMDGLLTKEEVEKALDLAERAVEKIGDMQEESLRQFYESPEKKKFVM
jgi:exosome complex component RRP41